MTNAREQLINQLIESSLNQQVQQMSEDDRHDRSFVYLENKTLNMILLTLLSNLNQNQTNSFQDDQVMNQLNANIEAQKKEFEEIIQSLKNT